MFFLRAQVLKFLWLLLCVPVPSLAQTPQPPIRIAMIDGLSGPFAHTGEAVLRNLNWAVQ